MVCPGCGSKNELAYSVLSNGLICLEAGCGFEIEMSAQEAQQLLEPSFQELVCA
jgi:hypothetical protein